MNRSLEMGTTNLLRSMQLSRGGRNQVLSVLPRKTNTHFFLSLHLCSFICVVTLVSAWNAFFFFSGKLLAISQSPKLSPLLFCLLIFVSQNFSHLRIRAWVIHNLVCVTVWTVKLLRAWTVLSQCYLQGLVLCKARNSKQVLGAHINTEIHTITHHCLVTRILSQRGRIIWGKS